MLKHSIDVGGSQLHDTIRSFHGDGPACEMEAGKQKNGRYPCWLCPANFDFGNDLVYILSTPHLNLKDCVQKIMTSITSQNKISNGKIKLYKNLPKHEIIDELHERGIPFQCDSKKGVLEEKLTAEMHGMQRLPSLMQADQTMVQLLKNYEILGFEPLHDIKSHIENLYTELPHHLNKTEKKLMEETISAAFDQKECKRGVDYRKSLIKLNIALKGKINSDIFKILSTLCVIQDILSTDETQRSVENILRLNNQIFLHACLLKEVVGRKPKAMTSRLLRGEVFPCHNLSCSYNVHTNFW